MGDKFAPVAEHSGCEGHARIFDQGGVMVKDMDLTVSKWDPSEHLETEEDGHRVPRCGGRA